MSKPVPTIQRYMTPVPHSVGAEQHIAVAIELMKKHSIRHLPVLKAGSLVGILSERDLKIALGIRGVDPHKTLVDEVSKEEVYITGPDAPLPEVVAEMAERKIGSAVIVQNHILIGIFTSTDALRILGEVFTSSPSDGR